MSKYKISRDCAQRLETENGNLRKALHGAIKSFCKDHPEWAIPEEAQTSLVKRLDGQIRNSFIRLFADRTILDWLEEHRPEWSELCKIRGGLRKVIADEIEKRNEPK